MYNLETFRHRIRVSNLSLTEAVRLAQYSGGGWVMGPTGMLHVIVGPGIAAVEKHLRIFRIRPERAGVVMLAMWLFARILMKGMK